MRTLFLSILPWRTWRLGGSIYFYLTQRRKGAKKKAQVRNYARGLIIGNIIRLNLLKITNYPSPVKDLKIGNTKVIGARSSTVIRTEVVVPDVIFNSGPFDEDQR
ncbi:hypothetical protein NIES22_44320 [Calothrix brevissima NIES-22]|nr:hypothetical protein NIES22_44320 [Calothrix brevissima NIES-22]